MMFDERARRAAVARAIAAQRTRAAPAVVVRKGRRSELRRLLKLDLPAVFVGDIRPLALGTKQALYVLLPAARSMREALRLEKQRSAIQRWLRDYTSRPEYLAALAAPESQRHALDGSSVGAVTPAHRAHAATCLTTEKAKKTTATNRGGGNDDEARKHERRSRSA